MKKSLLFTTFILVGFILNAQTWTQQNTNMSGTSTGVDQISAIDSNTVWINGFNGSGTTNRIKVFSHTLDGGLTWQSGTYNGFGATVFPYVLTGVTYNNAFAIAMDTATSIASFWKTTNGGLNWSLVTGVMNNGSTTFADAVLFWNSNVGFCMGDPVNNKFDIYYTNDGGTTWIPTLAANVSTPLSGEFGYNGYECASKFEGGRAAFVTNMGRVYKTSNYGVNWTVTTTAPFGTISTGKIYITGANTMIVAGMATGSTTYIWKHTTDGGATWLSYSPSGNFYTYAMTYVPNSENMLVSTGPYSTAKGVSYSTDGGANFIDFTDPLLQPTAGTNIQCLGVGFADATHGWIGNYSTYNSILKVVINLPSTADSIIGLQSVCQGQNSVSYTVPPIPNATSYIWTLPAGATGNSSSNSISVSFGNTANSGNITVKGHNIFGNGQSASLPIVVNPLPAGAGSITGNTSICQGQSGVTYLVPPILNATSYTWTLPVGATGSSSTDSIIVDYSVSSTSGNITVKGNNSCGNGSVSTLAIAVNPIPATPVISQNGNTLSSSAATGNHWYNSVSGIINNETAQTYIPQQIGNYFVIVTLNGCSSDSSNIIHFDNTGIQIITPSDNLIRIFPNPSNNFVSITVSTKNNANLSIFDITGKIIFNKDIQLLEATKVTFDFSHLAKGIYFVNYTTGNENIIKKMIIN
jgi:photosystem II stability/assembly factor-like uncharacterized protein